MYVVLKVTPPTPRHSFDFLDEQYLFGYNLKKYWLLANLTLRNKFIWNQNQNTTIKKTWKCTKSGYLALCLNVLRGSSRHIYKQPLDDKHMLLWDTVKSAIFNQGRGSQVTFPRQTLYGFWITYMRVIQLLTDQNVKMHIAFRTEVLFYMQ